MPSSPPLSTSEPSPKRHFCSFFLLCFLCFRRRKRTTPSSDSDSNPPHPFSYSLLRRATNSFSTTLGHGGFGPVFSGSLSGKPVAVKLMDSASLQGEREFHNELFFASRLRSPLVVPAIGFSSDPNRNRFLLVYHLMHNGNLHDALLRRKTPHLSLWKNRFSVALDIAKSLLYLHSLDPPVIHGDIKPSNILLDDSFNARIADFGLARLKTQSPLESKDREKRKEEEEFAESDCGSELETQSVNTEQSFEAKTNNEVAAVRDYVMDWIGSEVKKEIPKGEWVGSSSSSTSSFPRRTLEKKKKTKWWVRMEEEGPKEKRRTGREWWKEEYSEELARKKKKKKKKKNGDDIDIDIDNNSSWLERERDDGLYSDVNTMKKSGSGKGELRRARWNSHDSGSGEIGKGSTPSTRGTVFYVAPEYGYNGEVSEKCDVYSFGVLLLVIVSGRRPLEVTGSPLSEFKRANLVSWSRHCGRRGKLLEVVDQSVEGLDKEQAVTCVTVALLCLLKSPARRPSMKQVVGMLSGQLEPPSQTP